MDNKKKIIIAVVLILAVIAIAIFIFWGDKNTKTLYTISFSTNGGNEVVSQKVEEGKNVNKPKNPQKEGYEFLGWYLNGEYFDFETLVEKDLKLEARWKEIAKDENEPEIKEDKSESDDEPEIKENDSEKDEKETTNVTKYTVTFDSNGGSKVSKQTVEKNKTAKEPTNPTRSGYIFKGWYLGNSKYNFSKKITNNLTLKAKWEKVKEEQPSEPTTPVTPEVKKYTVTFNTDGGSNVAKQTVEEGKKATEPKKPTKEGYTFKGWYHNDVLFNFNTKIAGNVTLVAKWEKNAKISYIIENIPSSYVGQVKVFVLKDGEKVAGTVDITLSDGTVAKNVSIPKTGFITNGYDLKSVTNVRVK